MLFQLLSCFFIMVVVMVLNGYGYVFLFVVVVVTVVAVASVIVGVLSYFVVVLLVGILIDMAAVPFTFVIFETIRQGEGRTVDMVIK